MLGFWTIFDGGRLADAEPHFEAAMASGRDRSWIRNLEIATLVGNQNPAHNREAIRVANVTRMEKLSLDEPNRLWFIYIEALMREVDTNEFLQVIPPAEHVTTFKWLFPEDSNTESRLTLYRFMLGRLQEAAGDREAAIIAYKRVEDDFRRTHSTGPLLDRAGEGLKRLTKAPASGLSR
jgi:hypothetical protein